MDRMQRIKNLLKENFTEFHIEIQDNSNLHAGHNKFDGLGETHILIKLKSIQEIKINRLEVHRKINQLLSTEYTNGLHSLEIKIN